MTNVPGESPNFAAPEVVETNRRLAVINVAQNQRRNLMQADVDVDIALTNRQVSDGVHFVIVDARPNDVVPVHHEFMTFIPRVYSAMTDGIAALRLRMPSVKLSDAENGGVIAGEFYVNDTFIELVRAQAEPQITRYLLNEAGLFQYKHADDLVENPDQIIDGNMFLPSDVEQARVVTGTDDLDAFLSDPLTVIGLLLEGEYRPMRVDNRPPQHGTAA